MGLAKTFLAIGIAILFCVFIAYGVFVVYEPPKSYFEPNPCYEQFRCQDLFTKCKAEPDEGRPLPPRAGFDSCYNQVQSSAEYMTCMDQQETCEEEWKKGTMKYKHARNSFFVLLLIALAAIFGGTTLKKYEGIGSGFLGGGILLVLYSLIYTWEYWVTWHKYVKLVALGLVLAFLIYLGYKKIESHVKPKKKR